ncbi:MAG: LamG-like jellyroll fold domain-containing protein [Nannocystaceae bacterium]|nr:LamG domain-containing protein [bacterium]
MRRALAGAWLLTLAACEFASTSTMAESLGGSGAGETGASTSAAGASSAGMSATSSPPVTSTTSDPVTSGVDATGSVGSVGPDTGATESGDATTTGIEVPTTSSGGPLELAIAEELLVMLDAANGNASSAGWVNEGTLGDFGVLGAPTVGEVDGLVAATISANNIYRSAEAPPATLVEPNSTRTIEVWVLNPDAQDQESVVAWGRRNGGTGTLMVFGYGTQPAWGAVNHWGTPDLGWAATPQQNVWHHLVYTFDGEWTRIYVDGELDNEEFVGEGVIDTIDGERILVGAQTNDNGDLSRWATVSLAKVRIHAGALSAAEVANNYAYDVAELGL